MSAQASNDRPLVLLTGATGYVGGRLLSKLIEAGFRVRCSARQPERLVGASSSGFEAVKADLLDEDSLGEAVRGVDTAYYLVHSLGSKTGFEERERRCARNFARAANNAGVRRIVYLGGLASGKELSPHLRTRLEVGQILRDSGVETIEFRASIIIGSGSLSFELVRALTEKLPVMITPRWVYSKAQPIAVEDVLDYLLTAVEMPSEGSRIFEIGGPEVVSYADIIKVYAEQRGMRRLLIPVPLLTPYLSSLWLALARKLHESGGPERSFCLKVKC